MAGRFDNSTVRFVLEARAGPPIEATVGRTLKAAVSNLLASTVGTSLEAPVGRSETVVVGMLVGPHICEAMMGLSSRTSSS
jgi:hypothetical protein